jgi:hypothetical protein
MAMAENDDKMAEQAFQEMGYFIFCTNIKCIPYV